MRGWYYSHCKLYTQGVVHVRFCDTDKYSIVGLRVVRNFVFISKMKK